MADKFEITYLKSKKSPRWLRVKSDEVTDVGQAIRVSKSLLNLNDWHAIKAVKCATEHTACEIVYFFEGK